MDEIILELTNTSPMLVGWYDPQEPDLLGLRTTEVKGLWRWWCRAFIGGVMYEKGLLRGDSIKDVYLVPRREEVSIISHLIGEVMGLGRVGKEGSVSSRFRIWSQPVSEVRIAEFEGEKREYQRIGLLSFGGRSVKGIPPGTRFRLYVRRIAEVSEIQCLRLNDRKLRQTIINDREKIRKSENTALKILILSLQLSGIGKGARRGLGSLDIINIKSKNINGLSYEELKTKGLKQLIEEVHEECKSIVNDFIDFCYDSSRDFSKEVSRDLPPIPVVTKEYIHDDGDFRLTNILIAGKGSLGEFKEIHNFFLRSRRSYGRDVDELRRRYDAWIMGLPRSARGARDELETGYKIVSKDITRRASPIFIAFHTGRNVLGPGIYVTTLISGDWPSKLTHYSVKPGRNFERNYVYKKEIYIDKKIILDASRTLLDEFYDFLSKRGILYRDVWP